MPHVTVSDITHPAPNTPQNPAPVTVSDITHPAPNTELRPQNPAPVTVSDITHLAPNTELHPHIRSFRIINDDRFDSEVPPYTTVVSGSLTPPLYEDDHEREDHWEYNFPTQSPDPLYYGGRHNIMSRAHSLPGPPRQ